MSEFEQALLRLKSQINVTTDKEAAELLGMGEKALNARKRRGAFPVDKLRALAQQRPDLGIDVEYVLHGSMPARRAAAAAAVTAMAQEILSSQPHHQVMEPTKPYGQSRAPQASQALEAEAALLAHWNSCLPSDRQLLVMLAASLAEKKAG